MLLKEVTAPLHAALAPTNVLRASFVWASHPHERRLLQHATPPTRVGLRSGAHSQG